MSELFEPAGSAAADSVLGQALEAGAPEELAPVGDAVLAAAGELAANDELRGDAVLAAAGDAAGRTEAIGDSLLQAAGDIAGQAGEHQQAQAVSGEHQAPSGLEVPALAGERANQNPPTEVHPPRDRHDR